jgi:hypothetical protein
MSYFCSNCESYVCRVEDYENHGCECGFREKLINRKKHLKKKRSKLLKKIEQNDKQIQDIDEELNDIQEKLGNLIYEDIDQTLTNWCFYREDLPKLKELMSSPELFLLGEYKIPMDEFIDIGATKFSDDYEYEIEWLNLRETREEALHGLSLQIEGGSIPIGGGARAMELIKIYNGKHDANEQFPRFMMGMQILEWFKRNPDAETCKFEGEL